jgi:hypothetical protein
VLRVAEGYEAMARRAAAQADIDGPPDKTE